jgi:hypothetical protein
LVRNQEEELCGSYLGIQEELTVFKRCSIAFQNKGTAKPKKGLTENNRQPSFF